MKNICFGKQSKKLYLHCLVTRDKPDFGYICKLHTYSAACEPVLTNRMLSNVGHHRCNILTVTESHLTSPSLSQHSITNRISSNIHLYHRYSIPTHVCCRLTTLSPKHYFTYHRNNALTHQNLA